MSAIRDRIDSIDIEVYSDDETVLCRLNRQSGMNIELDASIRDTHTDESFEAVLEETLMVALEAYDETIEEIRSFARGGKPSPRDGSTTSAVRSRFIESVSHVVVEATSQKKYVAIEWVGIKDIVVAVKPGTLAKLDDNEIANEVRSALQSVSKKRSLLVHACFRDIYDN